MGDITAFVSNATNIAIWLLLGPIFAVLLFHMGEKRWGTGPTWAWLGMFFNVFALLYYLLLAGYEANESHSGGGLEAQRVRKLMHATRDLPSRQRNVQMIAESGQLAEGARDVRIDELLAEHELADALSLARERYAVAFQVGDSAREALYGRYVEQITAQDEARRAALAGLNRNDAA